jgi:hypothetical protein
VKIEIKSGSPDAYLDVTFDGTLVGYVTTCASGRWFWVGMHEITLADPLDNRDSIRGTGHPTALAAVEAHFTIGRAGMRQDLLAATAGCNEADRQRVIGKLLGNDPDRLYSMGDADALVQTARLRLAH